MNQHSGARIGIKAFMQSFAILLALMIVTGVLTRVIPAGLYDRIETEERTIIDVSSFRLIERPDYPIWRWFTAPLEVFIGSGSAKAFLLMPIILPIADLIGVTRQVAVTAYCLGDGFANMAYPTNAMLLISLGLTAVGYPKWLRWTAPLWGVIILASLVFLVIAVSINYGPF